jgi:hypothetical protein
MRRLSGNALERLREPRSHSVSPIVRLGLPALRGRNSSASMQRTLPPPFDSIVSTGTGTSLACR